MACVFAKWPAAWLLIRAWALVPGGVNRSANIRPYRGGGLPVRRNGQWRGVLPGENYIRNGLSV